MLNHGSPKLIENEFEGSFHGYEETKVSANLRTRLSTSGPVFLLYASRISVEKGARPMATGFTIGAGTVTLKPGVLMNRIRSH